MGILGIVVFLLVSILLVVPASAHAPILQMITVDDVPIMGRPIEPTPDSPAELNDLLTSRSRTSSIRTRDVVNPIIRYLKFALYFYQPLQVIGLSGSPPRIQP